MMKRTRTISVTSGKGGVGKTTIAANLALKLSQDGAKVLVLDGDLGMANMDIFFGVKSEGHIAEVLDGRKTMREVLVSLAPGLDLIPGGSGITDFNTMNNYQRRALLDAVSGLPQNYDYLIIDTAPGISDNVLYLNSAAEKIMVVVTPDPASLADSYALIKVLHQKHRENRFSVVCNQVRDAAEGFGLYKRFNDVVGRFLDVGLDYVGSLPMDPLLRRATQQQRLILRQDPQSESARVFRDLAAQIRVPTAREADSGGLRLFWEQVVGVA